MVGYEEDEIDSGKKELDGLDVFFAGLEEADQKFPSDGLPKEIPPEFEFDDTKDIYEEVQKAFCQVMLEKFEVDAQGVLLTNSQLFIVGISLYGHSMMLYFTIELEEGTEDSTKKIYRIQPYNLVGEELTHTRISDNNLPAAAEHIIRSVHGDLRSKDQSDFDREKNYEIIADHSPNVWLSNLILRANHDDEPDLENLTKFLGHEVSKTIFAELQRYKLLGLEPVTELAGEFMISQSFALRLAKHRAGFYPDGQYIFKDNEGIIIFSIKFARDPDINRDRVRIEVVDEFDNPKGAFDPARKSLYEVLGYILRLADSSSGDLSPSL